MRNNSIPTDENRSQALGYSLILVSLVLIHWVLLRFTTIYMTIAAFNFFLLSAGLLFRKQRNLHATMMATAIVSDLSLVLVLQFKREAIQTAVSLSMGFLPQMHIVASTFAVALYIPVLILGLIRLYRPDSQIAVRTWHLSLGKAAYVFRAAGFLLMFSMLQ